MCLAAKALREPRTLAAGPVMAETPGSVVYKRAVSFHDRHSLTVFIC